MSTPNVPDMGDLLWARMDDAPTEVAVNGASFDEAVRATAERAEQPATTGHAAEPAPYMPPPGPA